MTMSYIKLDLHNTIHYEVRNEVIRFIEAHWGTGKELEIVTGNSQRMKDIVIKVINEYGLDFQIGREFDFYNKGYIVIWVD